MRFFRTSDAALYEQARASLDATWNHAPPETCIAPAGHAPVDAKGCIVLAVNDEFCLFPAAAELLLQVLASGLVEEIDESTYMSAVFVR